MCIRDSLKTGYIIGATPRYQQLALMIGVVVSTVIIGVTLNLMNTGLQEFHSAPQAWDLNANHPGISIQTNEKLPDNIRVVATDNSTSTHQRAEYTLSLIHIFTVRALLLGSVFGIIFGAVTVYVGLRAGLTVAASIPISVLSISILRAFGRASILENNIVQTTGNAGQSIASGVIFTLPALVFLGFDLEYSRIFMLALIGGWLGVLFMIPLRRQLIVQEHGVLPYPEGLSLIHI